MPPNIVVFFTDDHAQWALPCYGTQEISAPSIDYLAETGVRMANAFTPTPVCSPARGSFWTGLYPSQHGIHDYLAAMPDGGSGRNWLEDHTTLAQILQQSGYETALSGKWHCGQGDVHHTGFDYWFSGARSTPKYFNLMAKYSDHGEVQEINHYETQLFTDHAIDFLRHRDQEKPFFLFIGYTTTHNPWMNRPERLVSKYRKSDFSEISDDVPYPFGEHSDHPVPPENPQEALAQYYASVTQIDEMVGRVLDELDALNVRDDTMVVYTSDHGNNLGQHQIWGKGNATNPLNMLEESIRVPLIINYPSSIPAGKVRDELVNHTDLFMTLLDFAGVNSGGETAYPGESYRTVLVEPSAEFHWRDYQICEYGPVRMIRNSQYKLVLRPDSAANLLIDLVNDPRETINLYGNPSYQPVVDNLKSEIDQFFNTYTTPQFDGLKLDSLPRYNPREAWLT